jgi:hypothetical protein
VIQISPDAIVLSQSRIALAVISLVIKLKHPNALVGFGGNEAGLADWVYENL